MESQDFKRKLSAVFMSADVAGYSRLMGDDEAATVKTLEAYKQVMFSLIKQHCGRVIDSPRDVKSSAPSQKRRRVERSSGFEFAGQA